MTEPADLSHGVLLRVAEFLKKLPAQELADLAAGEASLAVVPKGARAPARRAATRAGQPPSVTAAQARTELVAIGDPVAGRRWLIDQGLTVTQLVSLARGLEIAVRAKPRKDEVLDKIVHSVVSRQRDLEAIGRPAPARF